MEKTFMSNVRKNMTTKLVTPTRFRQILDCYGSSPSSWPEDERQAALNLLKNSAELRALQDEALLLDKPLDKLLEETQSLEKDAIDKDAIQGLQQQIMNQLFEQEPPASPRPANPRPANLRPNNIRPANQSKTEANEARDGSTHSLHRNRFWWGSIAASVFIIGLSLGVIHRLNSPDHAPIADQIPVAQKSEDMGSDDIGSDNMGKNEFTQWAWEDITGESLTGDSDNDPTTLLALVELELPAE
jgi:hypothetical protein